MGTPRFTPEFKEEAVRQITARGYSVAGVSDGLDVSTNSLSAWVSVTKNPNRSVSRTMTMPFSMQ